MRHVKQNKEKPNNKRRKGRAKQSYERKLNSLWTRACILENVVKLQDAKYPFQKDYCTGISGILTGPRPKMMSEQASGDR